MHYSYITALSYGVLRLSAAASGSLVRVSYGLSDYCYFTLVHKLAVLVC